MLLLIILFLFVGSLGLRAWLVSKPDLGFNPTRQYHAAIIARDIYFDTIQSVPEWRREIADINSQIEGSLELPIMENMAAFSYRLAGGEYLWIPRLLSAVFWTLGGIFLYLIASKIMSKIAAVFSTAFYLFLPFGLTASTSFQPDPMMVMLLLISIFLVLRYCDQPSIFRLLIATVVSALAFFVKPVCIFPVFAVFLAMSFSRLGFRKTITGWATLSFILLSLSPSLAYYIHDIISGAGVGGEFNEEVDTFFILSRSSFWSGWLFIIGNIMGLTGLSLAILALVQIYQRGLSKAIVLGFSICYVIFLIMFILSVYGLYETTIGYIILVSGLIGVSLFGKGLPRALLIGLCAGYFIFALAFHYHIHTHDYYSLWLIPIIALVFGNIFGLAINCLRSIATPSLLRNSTRLLLVLAAILFILELGFTLGLGPRLNTNTVAAETQIESAREIGDLVNHSKKTVFLAAGYGNPLKFYGEISGLNWPHEYDFYAEDLRAMAKLTAKERFTSVYLPSSPEFFIIDDMLAFENQPGLNDFLTSTYPKFAETDNYIVFDLRQNGN